MAQTKKPTTTKRPPDEFAIARRIYQRRKALLVEYTQALEGIDVRVKKMVDSLEEADAAESIEESPDLTPRDGGPLPTDD